MKAVTVSLLVLGLASVLSLEPIPFKLREISHKSIYDGLGPRIYGGTEAVEGEFPFMVFVMLRLPGGMMSQCSASLIEPDLVLLAAHCVQFSGLQPNDVIAVGGKAYLMPYVFQRVNMDFYEPIVESKFDLQERRAKEIHIDPEYNRETLHHDVALLRLNKPFLLMPGILETIPYSKEKMRFERTCTILGWGLTRGNKQEYKLNFVSNKRVATTQHGCISKPYGPFICLRPDDRGICQGDSGSPLVCDGQVWGVASHFVSHQQQADCGDSIEEYYSELYPSLRKLPFSSGYKSAVVSFGCLLLSLFFAMSTH